MKNTSDATAPFAAAKGSAFNHPNLMSPRLLRLLGMWDDWMLFKKRPTRPDSRPGYQPPRKARTPKTPKIPKDKYARRRQRLRAEGRCCHCGKPCAPYAECKTRRDYKRVNALQHAMKQNDKLTDAGTQA